MAPGNILGTLIRGVADWLRTEVGHGQFVKSRPIPAIPGQSHSANNNSTRNRQWSPDSKILVKNWVEPVSLVQRFENRPAFIRRIHQILSIGFHFNQFTFE